MGKLDFVVKASFFSIVMLFPAGCAVRYSEPAQPRYTQSSMESEPQPQYAEQPYVEEDLPNLGPEVSVTIAPPVVIGEPVYYNPPITVMYPYSYFYYATEPSGYVNLVFVDADNRRHVENWNVGGARMRSDRLDSWRRNYRISSSEYSRHRDHVNEHRHVQRSSAPQRQRSRSQAAPATRPAQSRPQEHQPATRANQVPRIDPSQSKPQPARVNQPSRPEQPQFKQPQPAKTYQAPKPEQSQSRPQPAKTNQVPKQVERKQQPPPPKKQAPVQNKKDLEKEKKY